MNKHTNINTHPTPNPPRHTPTTNHTTHNQQHIAATVRPKNAGMVAIATDDVLAAMAVELASS